jgi:glyoxylase-like metal-dependent hydrolase (beta-lactamase superfamily II)
MRVETFVVGAFQENTYLVIDETSHRAVAIDPGGDAERIVSTLRARHLTLDAIWLTHAHVDHVSGIAALRRVLAAPIYLNPADRPLYDAAVQHGLAFGIPVEAPPPPDRPLADGDVLRVGTLEFGVMGAPGHAPGHVIIHGAGVAFVGDVLFAGSIGRTDLPLANGAQLAKTLEKVAALPGDTLVYPGHGPATTIARELATNPFLNGIARVPGAPFES